MNKDYKQEIIDFINENNLNDIFIIEDDFYNGYECHLYVYIRVSTENQDFGRQILELYEWAKKKNIKICIDYIYCDKYTGKTLKRKAYEELRKNAKENDYILVTEVSRLGRNWDDIKKEWYKLKADNINLLIMDYDLLSANLPNEQAVIMNVDKKFMQENIFNGILYAACKKIEETSKSTKNGLKKARLQGKKLGRPIKKQATKENLITTLKLCQNENLSYRKACDKTFYPLGTFTLKLKQYKQKYNINNMEEIIKILESEEN